MRNILFAATPLIAACSTVPPASPMPGGTCSDAGLDSYVGQQASAAVGADIQRQSGARVLRWIPHNGVITMDLRGDRVNVRLDPQNRIESVTCG